MQLDWFTVAAQVVNFIVLVALLKRFLYGPIIRAMDGRQAQISSTLEAAQAGMTAAQEKSASYEHQLKQLQEERDQLLEQARAEAAAHRLTLVERARQEVAQLEAGWRRQLTDRQADLLWELRQHAGSQVCELARRALADLARAELENGMVEVFISRLHNLHDAARDMLIAAAQHTAPGLVVYSTFTLSADQQQRVREAIARDVSTGAGVQFAIKPELICGIELRAHGCTVAWHIQSYLEGVEDGFADILQRAT